MRKTSTLEKVGMVLGIIGAIMIISNAFVEAELIKKILAFDQFVFWLGILMWLFGYRKSMATAKKSKQTKNNEIF